MEASPALILIAVVTGSWGQSLASSPWSGAEPASHVGFRKPGGDTPFQYESLVAFPLILTWTGSKGGLGCIGDGCEVSIPL